MKDAIYSNVQGCGVYFEGPIGAIKEDYQLDFRDSYNLDDSDETSCVFADYDSFDDTSEIDYSYTDHDEKKALINDIFQNNFDYFLEYTDCGNWRGSAGFRFRTRDNVFEYSYEVSMDYLAHDSMYRSFLFSMSSHDVHSASHYYIGLTDEEYDILLEADNDEIFDWIEMQLDGITWIQEW